MKKFYEVPIYKSDTNVKKLEYCGDVVVSKGILGIYAKEVATKNYHRILQSYEIEKIGFYEYVTDANILINYEHHKLCSEFGACFYLFGNDLNKDNLITSDRLVDYLDKFSETEYSNELEKSKVYVKK